MRWRQLEYPFFADDWIIDQLTSRGYTVSAVNTDQGQKQKHQMLINGILVASLKQSKQRERRRVSKRNGEVSHYPWWQVDTNELDNVNIVIFICYDDKFRQYPFIIPPNVFEGRSSLAITSHPLEYKGYLSPFLYNWRVIDLMLEKEGEFLLAEYQGISSHE